MSRIDDEQNSAPSTTVPEHAARWSPAEEDLRQEHRRAAVFFFLTLVALYVLAQAHQQRVVVLLAFVLYVVGATLWVRVQYVDAIDGRPSQPSAKAAGWAMGIGVAVGLIGWGDSLWGFGLPFSASWLVVGGLMLLYIGAGYLVAGSRSRIHRQRAESSEQHWWRRWTGRGLRRAPQRIAVVMGVLLAAAWAALWGFGRIPALAAGVLCIGALAFVPWLLSLLSEHAIVAFERGRGHPSDGYGYLRSAS